MPRRPFSRPRTKVYDCNYYMGEGYYKPTLDRLDKKGLGRSTEPPPLGETIEPPSPPTRVQRPKSTGDLEAMIDSRVQKGVQEEMDQEMSATLRRIRAARAAAVPTPEESFESAFLSRREEVKKRSDIRLWTAILGFSEKMLDSVGINGTIAEEPVLIGKRATHRILPDDAAGMIWQKVEEAVPGAVSLRSRARLADLEAEMDEMAVRGAARERRAAGMRQVLAEEAANSLSLTKKMSVTTEKRSIAY